MEFGIQHGMLDTVHFQFVGQFLGFLNGHRTHKDRLTLLVAGLDLADDGLILTLFGFIHRVGVIRTDHRFVGGHFHHVQIINFAELVFLGKGRTGHTGQLLIHTEIVLEGDGGHSAVFFLDFHTLFGLDSLVQTVGEAASRHNTSRKGIDDENLVILDHVVDIPLHNAVGTKCLIDMVGDFRIFGIGEILNSEEFFCLCNTGSSHRGAASLLVHNVIGSNIVVIFLGVQFLYNKLGQCARELVRTVIQFVNLLSGTGDDQRRTCLIDEDGVHLVHDSKVVTALHLVFFIESHIVTQIVKAELIIGTVGDIAIIRILLLRTVLIVDHKTGGQTEEFVNTAHLLAAQPCQIFVDGNDVYTLTGKRIQIRRQGSHQGFTFTGFHLCHTSLMQKNTTEHLHVKGALTQHTVCRLTNEGIRIRKDIVQGGSVCNTALEFGGYLRHLCVRQATVLLRQIVNTDKSGTDFLYLMITVRAKQFCK